MAVDGALFVVDASGGVESGLETAVALGRSTGPAACFFINKCDRENADPTATLDALRATFGNKIAPLQLAIGAAESFTGYVDLVHRKAWHWDGGQEVEIPIPAELEARGRRPAATSSSRRPPRPTTTSWPSTSTARRSATRSSRPASGRASRSRSWPRSWSAARPRASACGRLLDAFIRYLPSPADEPAETAHEPKSARRDRRSPPIPRARSSCAPSRPPPIRSSAG